MDSITERQSVGTFSVMIEIGDLQGQRFEAIEALVDTGATATMVAASVLEEIGIKPTKRQIFEYANGTRTELDMAPIMVRIDGDETPTWVIFGEEGSSPILGAHALEGLLLGVDPYSQRLIPVRGLLK